jgi:hypothetical protein
MYLCIFSPGSGLGLFAVTELNWEELRCVKWTLTQVPGRVPVLNFGRTDSYFQRSNDDPLCYLGGPAHLLNAACNEHANTTFKCTPSNTSRSVWTTDIVSVGQELKVLYGFAHQFDIFCACGLSLLPQGIADARAIHQPHTTTVEVYRTTNFNTYATSDHVAALARELRDMERLIDEIRGVYEDMDTYERHVAFFPFLTHYYPPPQVL